MGKSKERPRLKVGVRFWRSTKTGQLHIGTSERDYLLPEKLNGRDFEGLLNRIAKGELRSTGDQSTESTLVKVLDDLNLLDLYHTDLPYQYREARIVDLQDNVNRNVALANYRERIEIEAAGISHQAGVRDGGIESVLARSKLKIEIHGENRLALTVFGALIASGFDDCQLCLPEDSEVKSRDLIGGYLQRDDLGMRKRNLVQKLKTGSSIYPERPSNKPLPQLVISIGKPSPEMMRDWLNRKIPQLFIDFDHPGALRIGPFVAPGDGACYNCLTLTEGESGAPPFGATRETSIGLELATYLVLTGAGAMVAEVSRIAAHGNSELHQKTILISLSEYFAPHITTWERHPRCGCNWI